jgi:hypothetical protein
MKNRPEHGLSGIGRRVALAAAAISAAISLFGALSATADAAACVASAVTDVYGASIYGPVSGNWSTAANWSLGAPPVGSETACWNVSSIVTVSTPETVGSIQAAGELEITGGSLTVTSSSSVSTLSLTGGELDGTSGQTLAVTGAMTWTGGTINAGGAGLAVVQTGAAGGTALAISGTASLDGGSIATTRGVTIKSLSASNATLTTSNAITLGNGVNVGGSGATFAAAGVRVSAGASHTYGFGSDGLVLSAGTTTVGAGNTFGAGALTITGGTLQDLGTVAAATTLTGGTLSGPGTVNGSLTNASGTVSPGLGVLTVAGDFAQGGAGTLAMQIGGTTTGTLSQLQVDGAGTTSLGGDVSLTDSGGFIPEPGNSFELIISPNATVAGAFLLAGPAEGSYTAYYDTNDVTLQVNPTPGSAVTPAIGGTLGVGQTLTCSPGTWSAYPTSYAYQWDRDGAPIAGATSPTYVVVAADQGQSLTCVVTASNSRGAGQPATSVPVIVPAPGQPDVTVSPPPVLLCAQPSGQLTGTSLGRLKLGFTRAYARQTLTHYTVMGSLDYFCLYGGLGIHAGYPSTKLLRTVSARDRARVEGRIVFALTANPYYSLKGTRAGMHFTASVRRRLRVGKAFHIGHDYWYFTPATSSRDVLSVRGGIVIEVGIADKGLTQGRAAQMRFLTAFDSA